MRGSPWKLGSPRSATSALRATATWHYGTPSTQGTFPAHECWSARQLWELPAATVMRSCFRLNITLLLKAEQMALRVRSTRRAERVNTERMGAKKRETEPVCSPDKD